MLNSIFKLGGLLIISICDEVLNCSTQKDPLDLDPTIVEEAEEPDEDDEDDKDGGDDEDDEDDEEKGNDGEEFNDYISDTGSAACVALEPSTESPLADLVFMLDDIADIISCLYTLSVAIRQPIPQDRHRKYAEINMSHYEFFDKQHVLEKFPNADPLLIHRLGNANTQRRQYFKYRLLHHEKIAKGLEHVGPATLVDTSTRPGLDDVPLAAPVPQSTPIHLLDLDRDADPVQGNNWSNRSATNEGPKTVITSTTISIVPKDAVVVRTHPAIEAESDGGQTATTFGTIMDAGEVKLLKVPDPPDADCVFAGNPFQCPYCYTLIIVKNPKAWR